MAFQFAYCLSGSAPVMMTFPLAANTVAIVGRIMNLESGYLDEGAAGDTALVGIALEDVDNTGGSAGAKECKCIINPDAVYKIVDANARVAGATLDLASSGSGIGASSSTDLIVIAPSAADEDTLVKIIRASHYLEAAV